jgi:hypothetical protein
MSYGCGPEGSRSDFQGISLKRLFEMRNSLKPRSRYEWHSRLARILGRIAAWSGRPTRRPRHRVHCLLAFVDRKMLVLKLLRESNIKVTRGALGPVVGRPGDTAFHFSMRR